MAAIDTPPSAKSDDVTPPLATEIVTTHADPAAEDDGESHGFNPRGAFLFGIAMITFYVLYWGLHYIEIMSRGG